MKRVALPWLALAAVLIGVLLFVERRTDDPVLEVSYDPGFSDHRLRHKIRIFSDGRAELHRYPPGAEMEVVTLVPRDAAEVARSCERLASGAGEINQVAVDMPYMTLSARKRGEWSVRKLSFMVSGGPKPFDWVERMTDGNHARGGLFSEMTPMQREALEELRRVLRQYSF